MSLETSAIVAISFGAGILALISLVVFFVEFNASTEITQKRLFYIKKWCLVAFIMLLNIGGAFMVYYTQNLQVVLFVIVVLKSKDILMAVLFVFNMLYRHIFNSSSLKVPELQISDEIERIIAFVPVYDESTEQITKTVDSLLSSVVAPNYVLPVIVSDGKNAGSDLIDTILMTKDYSYYSWKETDVNMSITYGTRNGKHLILMNKTSNQGKKDSIILINDLFNYSRSNMGESNKLVRQNVRSEISSVFGVSDFDYIVCTDGDTTFDKNAIVCLVDSMKKRNALACAGIVNADKSSGNFFWNNLQNYQYLYGQYMRRTNEDLWNQVLCLPGCISIIKIDEAYIPSLDMYSKLPNENHLLETSAQLIGTDRRFTSSVVYNSNGKIIQDTRSQAYTVVPQTFSSFFAQRKRWTHNMFVNSMLNIVGPNVNVLARFFNFIDVLRMSVIYFRLFNTLYFVYLLAAHYEPKNIIELVPYIVLLSYPIVCFFIYALFNSHLRNEYLYFLLFLLINKVFTMFTSLITFTSMLFSIGNISWKQH
jgi:cellulose synthase/poly-beta-1,6-N-acetylglucosamine synthase-like glycosyltransferase